MSFDENFLKRQYGLTVLSFGQNFSQKTIWVKPYFLLVKIFSKDNMGWTVLSFGENFLKRQYGLNRIVFWSKLPIKTIWIKLFCVLIKTFQKDYMDYLSIYMDYISFHQNFLKRQYGLNRIVFWWKFSWKTIWVEPFYHLVKMFLKYNMG